MTDPPPYAHLLKHRPSQRRSVERVEGLLDAAAALLVDREPEAVTVRDLAARAEVPTGTLYQFFDGTDAVLQALALRFLAAMPDVMDVALDGGGGDWSRTLGRVFDAYAEMVRREPAIRRLWLSGRLDAATRLVERQTDATLAERLGRRLRQEAGSRRGGLAQWQTLVALIDGLLRHAFAVDPDGDPVVLREGRLAARAYVAAVLGVEAPGPRRRVGG